MLQKEVAVKMPPKHSRQFNLRKTVRRHLASEVNMLFNGCFKSNFLFDQKRGAKDSSIIIVCMTMLAHLTVSSKYLM